MSVAVIIAMAVNTDGVREILGVAGVSVYTVERPFHAPLVASAAP